MLHGTLERGQPSTIPLVTLSSLKCSCLTIPSLDESLTWRFCHSTIPSLSHSTVLSLDDFLTVRILRPFRRQYCAAAESRDFKFSLSCFAPTQIHPGNESRMCNVGVFGFVRRRYCAAVDTRDPEFSLSCFVPTTIHSLDDSLAQQFSYSMSLSPYKSLT
jgi:hypothetical protein